MQPFPLPTKLALSLATLALGACETPSQLTKGGALGAFKPIQNSALAPCPMQRDVAEHNSRYQSVKTGKPVVYKAPCDVDKAKAAPPDDPKTS